MVISIMMSIFGLRIKEDRMKKQLRKLALFCSFLLFWFPKLQRVIVKLVR